MLYFDNAATTPMRKEVLEVMLPYMKENFYNPSSVYAPARQVRSAVDEARVAVANAINAKTEEIFFTSGGTEADNWAIKGTVAAFRSKNGDMPPHIITSTTEHHGILYVCQHMEKQGAEVTYLPVDSEGFISPADLEAAIRPSTAIISIMLANNEIGTIQPLAELKKVAGKIPFLTDGVCAVGQIPIDVEELGIDMLALSAHKFGGPKGIGALYIRKGTPCLPIFQGGAQERNRRAGTENVAGIIGLGKAIQLATEELPTEHPRRKALRDRLTAAILETIPHTRLNGSKGDARLPGNVNVSFRFIEGESLLLHLDMNGCCASTGSACSSGALEPSHVLMSLGLDHAQANGAIRFSLGSCNTPDDITTLMQILTTSVKKLRDLSPLYDDYKKKASTH